MDRVITKPAKSATLLRALVELTCAGRSTPQIEEVTETRVFAGMHVLLAEDNVVNQKLAVRLLQRLGAQVRVASNGLEALDALRTTPGLVRNPAVLERASGAAESRAAVKELIAAFDATLAEWTRKGWTDPTQKISRPA